jgi:uroporphyrinogen decarboxylase
MLASAVDIKNEIYGDKIDVIEYKYTRKEDIARTKKMGIKNLPTMCINGEIKWISLIPTKQELMDEINKKLK